jgi:hypothetical protein
MKNHRPSVFMTPTQLQEFRRAIDALLIDTETVDGNLKRLEIECNQSQNLLQSIVQILPTFSKWIDDHRTLMDNIRAKQQTIEEDIPYISRKLNEIKLVSNDGIYIWPITNVQEKIGK